MSSSICLPNTVKWVAAAVRGFMENIFHEGERQKSRTVWTDSSLPYWSGSVRQRAGRGLTAQKGNRPSTSRFYGHSLRQAVSVTQTASEPAIFDGGMYLLKPVFFFFLLFFLLCVDCLCWTWHAVMHASVLHTWHMRLWLIWWKILCICSSTPSPPQIRSYFQTPKIFALSLERAKRSPLSSIILSHPAKAVALGGSVKNFISDHGYICLLSVVLGFSSSLFVRLYYKNYNTLKPILCGFRRDWCPVWCESVVTQASPFDREVHLWPCQ